MPERQKGYEPSKDEIEKAEGMMTYDQSKMSYERAKKYKADEIHQFEEKAEESMTDKEREMSENRAAFALLFPELQRLEELDDMEGRVDRRGPVFRQKVEIRNMISGFFDNPESINQSLEEMSSMSPEEAGEKKRAAASEIAQKLLANKDRLIEKRRKNEKGKMRGFNEKSYVFRLDSLAKEFREGKSTVEMSFFNVSVDPFQPITNFSQEGHYDVAENNPRIVLKDEEDWLRVNGFLYFGEYDEIKDQLSAETKHSVDLLLAGAFVEYLGHRKGKALEKLERLQWQYEEETAKEKGIVRAVDGLMEQVGIKTEQDLAQSVEKVEE